MQPLLGERLRLLSHHARVFVKSPLSIGFRMRLIQVVLCAKVSSQFVFGGTIVVLAGLSCAVDARCTCFGLLGTIKTQFGSVMIAGPFIEIFQEEHS